VKVRLGGDAGGTIRAPGMWDWPDCTGGPESWGTPDSSGGRAFESVSIAAWLMRAGTANGLHFSAGVLRAAAPLFEGVPSYIDHAGPSDWGRAGGRSVRDLAGRISNVKCVEGWGPATLVADLHLFGQAGWVATLNAEIDDLKELGLSAVLWVETEGQEVTRIVKVESVDVVMNPAAGGRLLGAPAAQEAEGVTEMSAQTEQHENGALLRVEQAESPAAQPPEGHGQADATAQAPLSEAGGPDAGLRETVGRLSLEVALGASGLPDEARQAIRRRFAERQPDPTAVEEVIGVYREAYARPAAQAAIRGLGRVTDVLEPLDRVSLAVERLMGLPVEARGADVPRLSGIREAYDLLTGDWERHGVFRAERVSLANANTITLPQVVANALNKVLLRQFQARPRWWAPVAYEEDFATLNDVRWISLGGFSDLDVVGEGAPYAEKTIADSTEVSPFVKHGNYIGLTLEMIDRDDVAAVRAIPRGLAHAAYRTLSAQVAALFTANGGLGPLLADGVPLFDDAGHANLGAAALGAEAWQATVAAMFKQREANSLKRLGLRPRYCLVPIDLEKTALEIFTSDVAPVDSAAYRNVLQRSADSVVVVPDWVDTDDWAAVADPAEIEGVCIGYRFGRAPELFVADSDATGAMFTNDELRIKVRFVFAIGIGDYRALYKHIVD
jgi:hypothetical protein